MGHQVYIKHLKLLAPQLHKLALAKVRIIWMDSQSTLDSAYFGRKVTGSYVHLEKVRGYNQLARSIISKVLLVLTFFFCVPLNRPRNITIYACEKQEAKDVEYLVSHSELIVMDYIRSCLLNKRTDSWEYHNCLHWIHLGYVVIHANTHNFINMLCNVTKN